MQRIPEPSCKLNDDRLGAALIVDHMLANGYHRSSTALCTAAPYLWVMMMRELFGSVNDFRERMRLQIPDEGDQRIPRIAVEALRYR